MGFNDIQSLKLSFVSDRQPNLRCKAAKNKTRLAARKMLCATRYGLSYDFWPNCRTPRYNGSHYSCLLNLYREHGPLSISNRRRGNPGNRLLPKAFTDQALKIIKEKYSELGSTLA